MTTFQSMGLPEALNQALSDMQFTQPTPIQSEAIPVALQGNDILGSAQTGTGKTVAFGLPLLVHLMTSNGAALVMTPTRELATQVLVQLKQLLGKKSPIKSALLIGGDPIQKQLQQLRSNPRLIVGTPGRINDHLKRQSLSLKKGDCLVLDEIDRMLDMGFCVQIETIIQAMAPSRQTLLFSATLPKNIVRIAEKYLTDPVRISMSPTSSPAANIKQDVLRVHDSEKYTTLCEELEARKGSIIIFVKTKYNSEKMAKKLSKDGFSADAIHGDLRQNKRDSVISAFRKKKYRVLVATDVAARGLDIPHIEHVINYDLPQCPEDYIHRIGRTARAGAEGEALNLLTPADKIKWGAIEQLLNPGSKKSSSNSKDRPPNSKRKKPSSKFNKNRKDKEKKQPSTNSFSKPKKPKASFPKKARRDRPRKKSQ